MGDREGGSACLPVSNAKFNHSVYETGDISEMSAEQYMAWVRHQSEGLPAVFVAEVNTEAFAGQQTKYMPEVDGIAVCPETSKPNPDWVDIVLFDFSEVRGVLDRLASQELERVKSEGKGGGKERRIAVPAMKDKAAWHLFCLGEVAPAAFLENADEEEEAEEAEAEAEENGNENDGGDVMDEEGERNETNGAADMEIELLEEKKKLLAQEMGLDDAKAEDNDIGDGNGNNATFAAANTASSGWDGAVNLPPTITLLMQFDYVLIQRLLAMHTEWLNASEISAARGRWLYCLLARLEKPLYQDTAAVLRQLYRRCCELRAGLVEGQDGFSENLATLNVLICISGSYFGQGEGDSRGHVVLVSEENGLDENESDGTLEDGEVDEDEHEVC